MKKRIASIVLSVCLCLSLLPTAAFADEGGAAPTTPTRDCATEGHIDDDNDNKCDACGIGIWFTWADEAHTTKSGKGTWTFSEDGTLTILGTGPIELYQHSEETPWFECLASVKKLVIGAGITRTGSSSFSGSSNLTEVILPDSLTEIGTSTFLSCTALTTLRIPKGVTMIESGAFSDCKKLKAFVVAEDNTHFFVTDGVLFRRNFVINTTTDPETGDETTVETDTPDGTFTLIRYPEGKTGTSYAIPENVTAILDEAFRAADRLTELSLPASLTTIPDNELSKCSNLTTITVDENSTAYKSTDGVLFSADGTKLLCYPRAKAGSSYTIPGSVTEIGARAFFYVTALTSVTIPEGVTTIGEEAFISCDALREVTIPASVTNIEMQAFVACTSLTAIHVAEGNADYKSIDGVLFSKDGKTLLCCPIAKTGSYTVPEGVETIDAYAFSQSELTSVSLPEGVTTIGGYAFLGAEKLVSVSLPSTVTSIAPWAFSACYSLKHVYFAGSESAWSNMTIPEKDGWFGEEDTTNTCIAIDDTVTTIRYDFDGKLTVNLNSDGGILRDGTQTSWTVPYNTVSSYTPPAPTRSGYSFAGWTYSVDVYNRYTQTVSTTSRVWNWADPVYQDMALTASWSRNRPSYSVTLPRTIENGTIKSSHRNAEKGELVTLTVTPDRGWTLETLTITDKNGNAVELTGKGNGTFTFKMPEGEVTVTVRFAPDGTMKFVDVPANAYYYDAVLWAVQKGITGGVDSTHFGPDLSCTRAQLVTFLWRVAGCPAPNATSSFSDVSAEAYYTKAVAWAFENSIVGGYGNVLFGSDDTITREQMAVILYRFAQTTGMDTTQGGMAVREYKDYDSISDYAVAAIQWAVNAGVMQGYDGNLMPGQPCTRAQIVTMLYRLLGE